MMFRHFADSELILRREQTTLAMARVIRDAHRAADHTQRRVNKYLKVQLHLQIAQIDAELAHRPPVVPFRYFWRH